MRQASRCTRRLAIGIASVTVAVAAAVVRAAGADASFAVPPGLPSLPALLAVACPSATVCYAVGASPAAGVVASSSDAARTWAVTEVPGTGVLDGVSCFDATHCVAVGSTSSSGGSAAIVVTSDGRSWSQASVPAASPLLAVSCVPTRLCMAVGSSFATGVTTTSVLVSADGGSSWSARSPPRVSGTVMYLAGVQCLEPSRCYAVGGGAAVSDDLGTSWRDISPSNGCASGGGLCRPTYSALEAVHFVDATHGTVAGGEQCGGPGVGQCPAALFFTIDGGATWRQWAPSNAAFAFVLAVYCGNGRCLAASAGNTSSSILASQDEVSWSSATPANAVIRAITCAPSGPCVAVGSSGPAGEAGTILVDPTPPGGTSVGPTGAGGGGDAGAGGSGGAGSGSLSSLVTSLPTPGAVVASRSTLVLSALLVLALVLLVVFPSQLFNRTYEENHAVIRAWWERRRPWAPRPPRAAGTRGSADTIAYAVVLLVGAGLATLLDPKVGWNSRTLSLFVGVVAALLITAALGGLTAAGYRRLRGRSIRWRLHALPSGLVVAAACVAVSRAVGFQPGYLYGVIGGVAFAGSLPHRDEGHLVALGSVVTILVAVIAWLAWVPVSAAAAEPGAGFATAVAATVLSALFVGGLVGVVIGLVPLRFLPGEKLAAWHWGAWTAVFAVAMFGLLQVMLRPESSSAHVSSVPLWTTVGLFIGFGAASVAFWALFRWGRGRAADGRGGV